MNAVERIQAAIDKLERLKAETFPDQKVTHWEDFGGTPSYMVENGYRFRGMANLLDFGRDKDAAELHVALHSTIDPLLATLKRWLEYRPVWMEEPIVALADSILGDPS